MVPSKSAPWKSEIDAGSTGAIPEMKTEPTADDHGATLESHTDASKGQLSSIASASGMDESNRYPPSIKEEGVAVEEGSQQPCPTGTRVTEDEASFSIARPTDETTLANPSNDNMRCEEHDDDVFAEPSACIQVSSKLASSTDSHDEMNDVSEDDGDKDDLDVTLSDYDDHNGYINIEV